MYWELYYTHAQYGGTGVNLNMFHLGEYVASFIIKNFVADFPQTGLHLLRDNSTLQMHLEAVCDVFNS